MSRFLNRSATILCLAAGLLPASLLSAPAHAAPQYNLPIDVVGTFSDGTSLNGEFSLNVYGYVNPGWSFQTSTGTALDGFTVIPGENFSAANGDYAAATGAPDTFEISLNNAAYSLLLYMTFQHPLNVPGLDPFILDAGYAQTPLSGECYPYSCINYPNLDAPGKERLLVSGYAFVPEPASAALFGAGLIGLGLVRRRKVNQAVA